MVDPFFEPTYAGTREGNHWQGYWDEAGNTGPGSGTSRRPWRTPPGADQAVVQSLYFFNGTPYYGPTTSRTHRTTRKMVRASTSSARR